MLSFVFDELESSQKIQSYSGHWSYLNQIAQRFDIPLEYYQKKTDLDWCFQWQNEQLILKATDKQLLTLDWVDSLKKIHKMSSKKLQEFPLIKSFINVPRNKKIQFVWDATLGMGDDSLLLYTLGLRSGFSLCSFERNKILGALSFDARNRLNKQFATPNWMLFHENFTKCTQGVDLIYYDPMFSSNEQKKTKSSKAMEMAKILVAGNDDYDRLECIQWGISKANVGVLCKRSAKTQPYIPSLVTQSFEYGACSFDFYQGVKS